MTELHIWQGVSVRVSGITLRSIVSLLAEMEFLYLWLFHAASAAVAPVDPTLVPCGDAYYRTNEYTCYDGNFLCPIVDNVPTLRCGDACYLATMYSCASEQLVYPPSSSASASMSSTATSYASSTAVATCSETPLTLHLSDPPYEDYFYSDCHSTSQVIVTSPLSSSNLSLIGPRLLVAWPSGNSGIATYFAPTSDINGSLALTLHNFTSGDALQPVYVPANASSLSGLARVGITALIEFNSSATLVVPLLGSIRTMRDFSEGPSILYPEIQDAIEYSLSDSGTGTLYRLWLDNVTSTTVSFTPQGGDSASVQLSDKKLTLTAGTYLFNATFDYPQLVPLNASSVLSPSSQDLISSQPASTESLAFLSTTTKLLAGAWRFLTYFGRDSMISLLLLQPILSSGADSATEAVLASVLERLNRSDGAVCHEETLGDYATWLNAQNNITSTAALCVYPMIDTDLYLPVVLSAYLLNNSAGIARRDEFLATNATEPFGNQGLSYATLAGINANRIMGFAAPFAAPGGQNISNLHHLLPDQVVGQWRDSTYGIGGGRIPFDVNTALMPAALRAIAALSGAGIFPDHPDWAAQATQYAQVWEDETLQFFAVNVSAASARSLVDAYVPEAGFTGPSDTDAIDNTTGVPFYALALQGNNDQQQVRVMHTDTAFRLFLLNTTNDVQLTALLNATAMSILQPYPVGLKTDVGLLVANPAYGGSPVYAANWTRADYHGTVIWGWPMAMMAAGLERQLGRCTSTGPPAFCADTSVYNNVKAAYNSLWDVIDANTAQLNQEEWSWEYSDGGFQVVPAGELSPTEGDIVQLWSLAFLAVTRNAALA